MGVGARGINGGMAIIIIRTTEAVTGTTIETEIGMMMDMIATGEIMRVNGSTNVNGDATTRVIIVMPAHHLIANMPAKY
ncbi:hypothetical protein KSZ_33030 [Dictyobacter formicarum]|uniref:Uncharacterized protein n=1 Tax=Dictyobacter formicarum TaxID=2778368 RepID=A0ABQ3VH83_9CHLR|nr:hypothetical protein KSZ_33030 [Dictyobacter formicarum]